MAMQQQDTEIDGVINGRTAIAGLLAFAIFLISTLVLFLVRSDAFAKLASLRNWPPARFARSRSQRRTAICP
jgi:heme/copper-type cytochrome/quinol oxidase subunit 3